MVYPWKLYPNAVYWDMPDDGALFKCSDCGKRFHHSEVLLTQIPKDGSRSTICKNCIDDDWLQLAEYLGIFKE